MEKDNSRRNFLRKALTATASGAILTKTAAMDSEEKSNPILKVRPLGFQWKTQDPFLFCVHHEDAYPVGQENMGPDTSELKGRNIGSDFHIKDGWRMYHGDTVPGFPGHPHRGFETVTVVRKGMVDHSDSMGAAGRYGDGDVQWMTAGRGLQHAEMFPLLHQHQENPMELFQIWLNLPKKSKMVDPHFKMLWSENIPLTSQKDGNGKLTKVEVIAGKLANEDPVAPPPNSWAAESANEVAIWNIRMEAGAQWTLPKASSGVNRTLYFYKGDQLSIGEQKLEEYHSAELDTTTDLLLNAGGQSCNLLILQGKPIDEPVVQHGPFVMNSRDEIRQAFEDFQRTRFGGWPWSRYDQVHDRNKGRFAKHADGTLEERT